MGGEDPFGRLNAVARGHPDIHDHDVGLRGDHAADRLFTVVCRRNHGHVGFGFDQRLEAAKDDRMIVHDRNRDRFGLRHRLPPTSQ